MKSKLCWVSFIPLTLAVIAVKALETLGYFSTLPTNTLSYIGVSIIALMFALNIIFVAVDKKTSPAYLLTRNVPAAVFLLLAAACFVSKSALTMILDIQNKRADFMTYALTISGMACAICMVVIALAHIQGRNFLPRMGAVMLAMPLWAGISLINEFLDNRKVSVASVDSFKLFVFAFTMIFLFKLAMIIATVDGKNPVKAMYLYGMPMAGIGLSIGVSHILLIAKEGIDYSENVLAFGFASLSIYAVLFMIELTRLGRTKEEQIIKFDLDEYDEDQRIYGAFQDNYVAAPEEQTGDYDYDYTHAGVEAESFVTAGDENYTDDYDYYGNYGYGEHSEAEELVVAPDAEANDDVIYVDLGVAGDFEEKIIGEKSQFVDNPINAPEAEYSDEDMERIDRLLDDINS